MSEETSPDNRLALFDEGVVRSTKATGRVQVMQCTWIYERPVDFDEIRRFHSNFGYGMAGRRVERSPLPFGRYRWVSALGPASPLEIGDSPLPRAELSDWVDARAQQHVDAEAGPGWHLAVQSFTDGATAITVVGSHWLADGVAALHAISAAVTGANIDLGYPPPLARSARRAIVVDLVDTLRGLPEAARAVGKVAKHVRAQRRDSTPREKTPSLPLRHKASAGGQQIVAVPAISLWLDTAQWDERAAALGGNSYTLLAGVAARLAAVLGRRGPDGAVTLLIAMNERTEGDYRANAMSLVSVAIDPTSVTKDLTSARAAIKTASTAMRDAPDDPVLAVLPIVPLLPKKVVQLVADNIVGHADLPVACSNLGALPDVITRVDGTIADYTVLRGVDQAMTRAQLERADGHLVLVSCRVSGKITVSIEAYEVGADNSKARLRELAAQTLAEFELAAVID